MSIYKEISYKVDGINFSDYIGASSTGDILATFLTKNKIQSWITDDFNLDSLNITYNENTEPIVSNNSEPIVDFNTLVKRFDTTIDNLKKKGLIQNDILDLYDFDDKNPNSNIYGWDILSLASTLNFIKTIINVKNNDGVVSF